MSNWNVVLNKLENNKVISSTNNPKKDGRYLCTCIQKSGDDEYRYLQIMEYNTKRNYWHDCGNQNGTSHNVLVWKEEDVCDFAEFDYCVGTLFEKEKEK